MLRMYQNRRRFDNQHWFDTLHCTLLPCPFTGPKMFWAVPNFLCQTKTYLQIVEVTNILCQTKRWFALSKIGFCAGTKVCEEALNAVKFLGWHKKVGPVQNILRAVKGQGISTLIYFAHLVKSVLYSGV